MPIEIYCYGFDLTVSLSCVCTVRSEARLLNILTTFSFLSERVQSFFCASFSIKHQKIIIDFFTILFFDSFWSGAIERKNRKNDIIQT